MKVFITGGTGLQGTYIIEQLIAEGHIVTALARSPASTAKAQSLGAIPVRGDHQSLDVLREQASLADAVLHLAFNTFETLEGYVFACDEDRAAIEAMCEPLVGTSKTFIYASGTLLTAGETEDDPKEDNDAFPRILSDRLVLSYATKGVRAIVVRCPPVVHSATHRHLFITSQIDAAKKYGYAAYIGDGQAVWPSVHAKDAANVYVLALDPTKAPSGVSLHPVAEEAIPVRTIAEFIGQKLNVGVKSIPPEQAFEHFGFTGMVLQMSNRTTSNRTREWLGWEPKEIGLLEELEGYDF
ncbi:hypothetical protein I316_07039 [Kwoniella heveanensis BCC8398]|uniref:NAD-dependent epimerase/dehydratase domain-containing protein n=1 Tax=Kwoniella heveanensis BCC8398 TaxID=1296120 RepID=A0A1B9GJW8_9TREE|nr:hypothetical protein I316_07039 [Kwoniella heveanensis BCC8398]